jgi:chromate reductase
MQVAFHSVFQFLNMRSVYQPQVLINNASKKLDESGQLTDDLTKDLIRQQLLALRELILQLRK